MTESNMQKTHNPYTPTTEEIRAGWEYATAVIGDEGTAQFDRWFADVKADVIRQYLISDSRTEYDRMLAEVKAQACSHTFAQQLEEHSLAELIRMAKADGFDEGWDARVNAETITPTENPYRQGETE